MADSEAKKEKTAEQIKKLEQLQDLILDDFIKGATEGSLSATDRATIIRLLQSNGWTLDPSQLPTDLRSKLTAHIKFDDDLSEGETGERRMRVV